MAQVCSVERCHVDAANLVVTAPAYMYGSARMSEVAAGIRMAMREVVRLAGAARTSARMGGER